MVALTLPGDIMNMVEQSREKRGEKKQAVRGDRKHWTTSSQCDLCQEEKRHKKRLKTRPSFFLLVLLLFFFFLLLGLKCLL